jgi:hypothetical protein
MSIFSVLKKTAAGAAVLLLLVIVLPIADNLFNVIRVITAMGVGDKMRIEDICADLMKGDTAAASRRIARQKDRREFNLANAIVWLAGKGGAPYTVIPQSPLFTDLPGGQGQLLSCQKQGGHSYVGGQLYTQIYLNYPKTFVTVSLHYSMNWTRLRLEYIKIYSPQTQKESEPVDTGTLAAEQKAKQAALAAQQAAAALPPPPPAAPLVEPSTTGKGFVSRYGCLFPLPRDFEADARFSSTEKDIELVMIYYKGLKERAWTAPDTVNPAAIAIEIVPLKPAELKDPQYAKKVETGLYELMRHNGWEFSLPEEYKEAPLKAYITQVQRPAHVRVRLYGRSRLYKFTSRVWDARLQQVLKGFSETSR